ncbi:MAG TPA: glycosyl hydrolase family 65 protein, partial [Propionibacteriaceae bacterium]|nr:glycosyl hydrolase family 65 protein [Propionibacteriaceae bacterium]
QAIVAAEVGYMDLAVSYFAEAVHVDLADLHHNADAGVHAASVGGVWSALVGGFGGMRDYGGTITFDPRLPDGWDYLSFPLTLRGSRVRVRV